MPVFIPFLIGLMGYSAVHLVCITTKLTSCAGPPDQKPTPIQLGILVSAVAKNQETTHAKGHVWLLNRRQPHTQSIRK